jgi:hypothetical protein
MKLERCEERLLLSTALVSVNAAGTAPGSSASDSGATNGTEGPISSPQDSAVLNRLGSPAVGMMPLSRRLLFIRFDFGPRLEPTAAATIANYTVNLTHPAPHTRRGHGTALKPPRVIPISEATYDPTWNLVELTLAHGLPKGEAFQLDVAVHPGALIGANGATLNIWPLQPGSDYHATVLVPPKDFVGGSW